MLLKWYFPFPVFKQKNYFIKNVFVFLAFTTCFLKVFCVPNFTAKLPKVRILFRRLIPNGMALFQKTGVFNKFNIGKEKEE